jgi:recyclin-1
LSQISEYVISLLIAARAASNECFLKASAACFRESSRLVDTLIQVATDNPEAGAALPRTRAEDVVCVRLEETSFIKEFKTNKFTRYRMFETNMDEYLDEEVEFVKLRFDNICRAWSKTASHPAKSSGRPSSGSGPPAPTQASFLASSDPAQMKRTVLASFSSVLLLPVTIVPRAAGAVGAGLTTAGSAAVQGISMLDPRKWGGSAGTSSNVAPPMQRGYSSSMNDDGVVFDLGADDEEEEAQKEADVKSIGKPM